MISRFQHTFGVTDLALSWFMSYFAARLMSVRRCGISSALTPCNYDVPQGSALRLLCFSLDVAPLSCVIGSFGVQHHQYADDTQMYIAASKANLKAVQSAYRRFHQRLKNAPPLYIITQVCDNSFGAGLSINDRTHISIFRAIIW